MNMEHARWATSDSKDAMAVELISRSEIASGVRPNRGPFASEDQALDEVVSRLVRALDPQEIWLFGSRVEGRNAPDSDLDQGPRRGMRCNTVPRGRIRRGTKRPHELVLAGHAHREEALW
jgi:hypothetical protein